MSKEISLSFFRNTKTAQTRIGTEAVLLQLETGVYYGLDPIGTRIWELLETAPTLEGICGCMIEEFNVNPKQLIGEVHAFIQELLDFELIVVSEG